MVCRDLTDSQPWPHVVDGQHPSTPRAARRLQSHVEYPVSGSVPCSRRPSRFTISHLDSGPPQFRRDGSTAVPWLLSDGRGNSGASRPRFVRSVRRAVAEQGSERTACGPIPAATCSRQTTWASGASACPDSRSGTGTRSRALLVGGCALSLHRCRRRIGSGSHPRRVHLVRRQTQTIPTVVRRSESHLRQTQTCGVHPSPVRDAAAASGPICRPAGLATRGREGCRDRNASWPVRDHECPRWTELSATARRLVHRCCRACCSRSRRCRIRPRHRIGVAARRGRCRGTATATRHHRRQIRLHRSRRGPAVGTRRCMERFDPRPCR